ncbi:hypothetical protein QDA08_gp02 [Microbacterium phage NoodlelyBoi]|uniref:Uncharacterized protein n=1 Tax=Microbacterium phage NoodlelyBoi TaxID=2813165 RepID=A0A899IRS0_9CAUD|nr:hypothetical protein QDA08_gp02 [Microbacterium phage NoodlelyBoi]QSM01197.1 hypothetical protein SEA_NOODLELYBOI_2 [Microbacterium phage NoodlelyBoi]
MTRHMSVRLGDPSTPCTLGRSQFDHIEYPGPVVSYSWRGHVLPAHLVESIPSMIVLEDNPLSRALLSDVLAEATPNRAALEWGPLDEVRFGA